MVGNQSKEILATSNYRWMSLFFFAAAVLAFFQISDHKPMWFRYAVVLITTAVGIKIFLTKAKSTIWIEGNCLCFDVFNQGQHQIQKIEISEIVGLKIKFSGSRLQHVRHACFVITKELTMIELPSDIKYCSYNRETVHLDFLAKPLRRLNSDINIEIEDDVVGTKIDFGTKT